MGSKVIKGNRNIREALLNMIGVVGYGNVMMIAQDLKLRLTKKGEKYIFYIPDSLFVSEQNISKSYQLVDEEEVVGIITRKKRIISDIENSFKNEVAV